MPSRPPDFICIDPDDYHAEHVGRTPDGRQFFLTAPFVPAISGAKGCEFVALFLFDESGELAEAKIDSFGPRETSNENERTACYKQRLQELGDVSLERITIKPFSIERYDTTFGCVPSPPEDEDEGWTVELHPGNYMSFHEPWDSGEYDT